MQLAGSSSGKARAEKLTREERSDIARRGALARWEREGKVPLPVATHGSDDHPLVIGNIEIQCYVLEDSTRVITNRGLQRSLGMAESGGAHRLAAFLTRIASNVLDVQDLVARLINPIEFQPLHGGRSAFGYEATVLADLCDMLLAARKKGPYTHGSSRTWLLDEEPVLGHSTNRLYFENTTINGTYVVEKVR